MKQTTNETKELTTEMRLLMESMATSISATDRATIYEDLETKGEVGRTIAESLFAVTREVLNREESLHQREVLNREESR